MDDGGEVREASFLNLLAADRGDAHRCLLHGGRSLRRGDQDLLELPHALLVGECEIRKPEGGAGQDERGPGARAYPSHNLSLRRNLDGAPVELT